MSNPLDTNATLSSNQLDSSDSSKLEKPAQTCSSTVQRLPAEIVLEVAELFMLDEGQATNSEGMLWVLAKICREWRETLLDASWLWTNVLVRFGMKFDFEHDASILKTWLARSRKLPLKIEFRHRNNDSHRSRKAYSMQISKCLEHLVDECERWWEVKFSVPIIDKRDCDIFWDVFHRVKGRLPLLRQLSLSSCDGSTDAFEIAPALRCVIIRWMKPNDLGSLLLPSSQITQLEVDAFSLKWRSAGHGLRWLAQFCNLRKLTIMAGNDAVYGANWDFVITFKSTLTFPNLCVFTFLDFWGDNEVWDALVRAVVPPPVCLQHGGICCISWNTTVMKHDIWTDFTMHLEHEGQD